MVKGVLFDKPGWYAWQFLKEGKLFGAFLWGIIALVAWVEKAYMVIAAVIGKCLKYKPTPTVYLVAILVVLLILGMLIGFCSLRYQLLNATYSIGPHYLM